MRKVSKAGQQKVLNSDGLRFRFATESDAAVLQRLIQNYYQFDKIPFRPGAIKKNLHQLLRDASLGRALLCSKNDRAIGYAMLIFWFDTEFGGRCAALTDFYVSPGHRRKGVGRRMMRQVEKYSIESRCHALELQVERDNSGAMAFYKALGFRSHSRIPMSKHLR